MSANVAVGATAEALASARDEAAKQAPVDATYAKGAFVAAAVAPGLAPFVAARVGAGNRYEGGIAYTGRGARIDMRRSFDVGQVSYSVGAGVSGAFYGHAQGSPLPGVDLASLHGYGADVPLLVGWQSDAGLYMVWGGARAGYEHDTIESLTSEPAKTTPLVPPPVGLDADRFYGGGVLGAATGFRHVHVAIEVDVYFQSIKGSYADQHASIQGVSVAPASAIWWDF
jgi:hypothetical protein